MTWPPGKENIFWFENSAFKQTQNTKTGSLSGPPQIEISLKHNLTQKVPERTLAFKRLHDTMTPFDDTATVRVLRLAQQRMVAVLD